MALREIKKDDPTIQALNGILLNLDNGDLAAVDLARNKLGFKDRVAILRYAIAVLAQSDKSILYVDKDGDKIGLAPSRDLLQEGASHEGA